MIDLADDAGRIFAAGDVTEAAMYFPAASHIAVSIYVMRRRADDEIRFSDRPIVSETGRFLVLVADVAAPASGDRIEVGADSYVVQGEPKRHERHLWWDIEARPE